MYIICYIYNMFIYNMLYIYEIENEFFLKFAKILPLVLSFSPVFLL